MPVLMEDVKLNLSAPLMRNAPGQMCVEGNRMPVAGCSTDTECGAEKDA